MKRIGSPLDEANETFHEAYDAMRGERSDEGVILALLGDELFVVRGSHRERHAITPREVHALKSLAHVPPAVFAVLRRQPESDPSAATCVQLGTLRSLVQRVRAALAADLPDETMRHELRPLLAETLALLDRLEAGASIDHATLDAYAARCGPLLLRCTEHATRAQLHALDIRALPILERLSAEERERLQIVVGGDHQARARSLGMQYFVARLGEDPRRPRRIAFGEGISSVDEAVQLVGTRRADHLLAQAFFGDPERLQRDVLGDAAAAILEEARLTVV